MAEHTPKTPDILNFDALLNDLNQADSARQDVERAIEERNRWLWQQLASSNVPRLIDSAPAEQERRISEAVAAEMARLHTEGDTTDEITLQNRALEAVYSRVSSELFYFHFIAIGRISTEDNQDTSQIEKNKKQTIASLIVAKQLEPSDPWVAFANQVIPGPAFDPGDPADALYILTAAEESYERDADHARRAEILDRLSELVVVHGEQTADEAMLVGALISMAMVAPAGGGNAAAERRSRLDELLREHQIVGARAEVIVAFLEDAFPVAS